VIQGNGTMLLQQAADSTPVAAPAPGPIAGQPYQVPAGYTGYGAGAVITYGGYNYVIQGDGTMLLQSTGDSAAVATDAQGSVAAQPYQVPADFAGYAAGSVITYGGLNYVIQGDGTMLLQQPGGYDYNSYYVPPGGPGYFPGPGFGPGFGLGYGPGFGPGFGPGGPGFGPGRPGGPGFGPGRPGGPGGQGFGPGRPGGPGGPGGPGFGPGRPGGPGGPGGQGFGPGRPGGPGGPGRPGGLGGGVRPGGMGGGGVRGGFGGGRR